MVPKLDQRRGYASKLRIPPHRSVAIDQGEKATAGSSMRQEEGQEFRQITELFFRKWNFEQALFLLVFLHLYFEMHDVRKPLEWFPALVACWKPVSP
jgi:hypothetical protein